MSDKPDKKYLQNLLKRAKSIDEGFKSEYPDHKIPTTKIAR